MPSLDESNLFSPSSSPVLDVSALEESRDEEEVKRLAVEAVARAREEAKKRERGRQGADGESR